MPCEGPVHLRRATIDDAAGIAQVHSDGWLKAHRDLVPPEYLHCISAGLREEFWRGELAVESPDRMPWLALIDGRIVGFASGGITHDGDADSDTGEVYLLVVDPACWSQGIRTSLIEHVVRDLREHGFSRATFWILAGDTEMRRFAEHIGWTTDGATRFEECGGIQVEQVRYGHQIF